MSFVLGLFFGAIFGIIDVEAYSKNQFVLYSVLQFEISICEPISLICGCFTGFMIEYLRQEELINRAETSPSNKESPLKHQMSVHFPESDDCSDNEDGISMHTLLNERMSVTSNTCYNNSNSRNSTDDRS